jgi:DNA-binding LytR/AlgR family response regulator
MYEQIEMLMYEPNQENSVLLRTLIRAAFLQAKFNYNLLTYDQSAEALKTLSKNEHRYDIVLLNIDDMETAKKISANVRARNPKTAVIFLGGDYIKLCNLLIFRPSAYIPFPVDKQYAARIVCALHREQRANNRCFPIRNRDETERIPYEQIDYFESSNRKVYLHINSGAKIYEFNAKMDDVVSAVAAPGFIRCHQSYLVNLNNVRKVDKVGRAFIFFSGKSVDIAKRSVSEAVKLFEQYVTNNR